eukprot:6206293-Pleurochrysis_carterae.AAC.1
MASLRNKSVWLLLVYTQYVVCPKGLQIPTSRSFTQNQSQAPNTVTAAVAGAAAAAIQASQSKPSTTEKVAAGSVASKRASKFSSCQQNVQPKAKKMAAYQFTQIAGAVSSSDLHSVNSSSHAPSRYAPSSAASDINGYRTSTTCDVDDYKENSSHSESDPDIYQFNTQQ